jgi:hypothetical protein
VIVTWCGGHSPEESVWSPKDSLHSPVQVITRASGGGRFVPRPADRAGQRALAVASREPSFERESSTNRARWGAPIARSLAVGAR